MLDYICIAVDCVNQDNLRWPPAQHGFRPVTTSLIRINGWYSGITQVYPLFTEPSEGRSYTDLGSIPGPFLWHNYQPVESTGGIMGIIPDLSFRIYRWHHGNQPGYIRYSPIRPRVDPTLTSVAFQVIFSGTTISQSESTSGILGIIPYLSVYSLISGASQIHFFCTVIIRAVYVRHHGSWRRSIGYSVICSFIYHCQQKYLQSQWLRGVGGGRLRYGTPAWIIYFHKDGMDSTREW